LPSSPSPEELSPVKWCTKVHPVLPLLSLVAVLLAVVGGVNPQGCPSGCPQPRTVHSATPRARRADVVGILPTDRSVLRLVGALVMEQDEEWMLARRFLPVESMEKVLKGQLAVGMHPS